MNFLSDGCTHLLFFLLEVDLLKVRISYCNNNNLLNIQSLSRVDVVLLFWSLIPVFPCIQTVAYVFYSQSNFIGSYFLCSPRRQAFLIDFICVLLIVLWVAVSGLPPFSNLFLLIFSFYIFF